MNATSCYWSFIDFFTLFTIIYLLALTILTQPLEQNSEAAAGDVLKIFPNFTEKHLCWSLFFKKLQAFRPATLLKKDSYTGVFLLNLRNSEEHLFRKTSERLLLCIDYFIIYWFLQPLQYTICIFTNNFFFIYYAIKTIELMARKVFLSKKYFTERNF